MPHASEKLVPAAPARWRQWGMTLLWTTPVLFLILALLYGVLTRPPTDSDHSAPRLGQSLADFTLPDLQGRLVQLAALRGKVVFINVWATWCPPLYRGNADHAAAVRAAPQPGSGSPGDQY